MRTSVFILLLTALPLAGCPTVDDDDATANTPEPTPTPIDRRAELLQGLDNSTWHGTGLRDGIERDLEIQFRAGQLLWAEIQNPWGPARHREMRIMEVASDGVTVDTTVTTPPGWELTPDNGRTDTWSFALIDGPPRQLNITRDAITESFSEGAIPAPTNGMTAILQVFAPGSTVDSAFCNSGLGGFDYQVFLDFARGGNRNELMDMDVVAGAPLSSWDDPSGMNNFAVTDVAGFSRLGGTTLSDQFNFMVTFLGDFDHPGGTLSLREADDSVEDGIWAFIGNGVGSSNTNDIFLEVHGFLWPPDLTADEPSVNLSAGLHPIEFILMRCTEQIIAVDPQFSINGNPWALVADAPISPVINTDLFPPAF